MAAGARGCVSAQGTASVAMPIRHDRLSVFVVAMMITAIVTGCGSGEISARGPGGSTGTTDPFASAIRKLDAVRALDYQPVLEGDLGNGARWSLRSAPFVDGERHEVCYEVLFSGSSPRTAADDFLNPDPGCLAEMGDSDEALRVALSVQSPHEEVQVIAGIAEDPSFGSGSDVLSTQTRGQTFALVVRRQAVADTLEIEAIIGSRSYRCSFAMTPTLSPCRADTRPGKFRPLSTAGTGTATRP
ncbi:MAG: hypothetical protein JF603_05390 [Acidobacteria bacterium]|nr:hypothetical protein [Acidobacteriota bacterium]